VFDRYNITDEKDRREAHGSRWRATLAAECKQDNVVPMPAKSAA